MNYEDLSPELKEKAKACKTADEFVALAKAEGVELTDEDLNSIAGGEVWCGDHVCEGFQHYSYC